MFGLSPEWLLDGGEPVVDVMVLSHPEQQERLDRYSPAGAPRGVLGGDPCFDRMLAARPYRERYRRALGVREGQRLLILNSTWNAESLFGDGPADEADGGDVLRDLLDRLAAQLPLDDYRLAAVLHPNIWHGHGPGQVRAWLDGACRGGLGLVDPLTDWRQAVIAADLVIGDFGSVSYYAAALGTPVLLGASGESRLDPHSPVAGFVRAAPRLDLAAPLLPQLDRACAQPPPPGPAELTTSHPGRSAPLLRSLFYELIGVAEPGHPALLDPLPLPGHQPPRHLAPVSVRTWRRPNSTVEVARYSAPPTRPPAGGVAHLAVHEDTLDPESLDLADLIFREGAPDDPLLGTPEEWTAEVLARHPHAALAARITGPGSCLVRLRDGEVLRLDGGPRGADPAACASALFGWLAEGGALAQLTAEGLTLATGGACHRVRVTRG